MCANDLSKLVTLETQPCVTVKDETLVLSVFLNDVPTFTSHALENVL